MANEFTEKVFNKVKEEYHFEGILLDILEDLRFNYYDIDEAMDWLNDVMRFGCAGGSTKLIYETDILEYMHIYMTEIEEIVQEYNYMLEFNNFSFTNLVWFAYEIRINEMFGLLECAIEELEKEEE